MIFFNSVPSPRKLTKQETLSVADVKENESY